MKFLLYAMTFILLDAIVPRSCRNNNGYDDKYDYYYEESDSIAVDSLESEPADSINLDE